MSETGTLRIHAQVRPPEGNENATEAAKATPKPQKSPARRRAGRPRRQRMKLTASERLLRNSACACAVLLGVLALGNVNEPWAKKASGSVERALTMRIDLDESIGALQFVKNLMPESALVFMNLSGESALERPVEGPLAHSWSDLQPWLMFNCADGAEVRAAAAGTVTAVSPMSDGLCGILVDHGEGVETLYARLSEALLSPGDTVKRGQPLGRGSDCVYFEYRVSGESVDPSEDLRL